LAAQGLRLIELVLDQQPTRINSELVSRATRLDLRQLSTELGRVAALLPGAESSTGLFAGGLRDLHELHPRLNSLIAAHGHGQALHNNLAPFHRFPMLRGIMWMKLRDAGREIADLYQTADWARRLTVALDGYESARSDDDRLDRVDDFKQIA